MLLTVKKKIAEEYVTLFINIQKLIKIMTKIENRRILNTGMKIIYIVWECRNTS